MLLRDSVVRRRAPLIAGGYGTQVRDWPNATSVTYPAEVQPVSSTEDVVDQQRTITRWRLWLAPTDDLAATDRIEWDGGTYEVDGDVERWKRHGRQHHLRAVLVRVTQGS